MIPQTAAFSFWVFRHGVVQVVVLLALIWLAPRSAVAGQLMLSIQPTHDVFPLVRAVALDTRGEDVLLMGGPTPLRFSLAELSLQPASTEAGSVQPEALTLTVEHGVVRWVKPGSPSRELLALAVLDAQRFVLWTPQGYYYAKGDGATDALGVWAELADGRRRFIAASELPGTLWRPDLVRRALAPDPVLQKDALGGALPLIGRMVQPGEGEKIEPRAAWATVEIFAPQMQSGAQSLVSERDFARGLHLIPGMSARQESWREQVRFHLPPPPRAGEPRERVLHLSPPSLRGRTVSLSLSFREGQWRRALPDLYVLAVGVNDYEELASLRFAAKDAADLAASLAGQAGRRYRRVVRVLLRNREVGLRRLTDELRVLRASAREQDVVMLFFAGHGVTQMVDGEPRYYFLPPEARLSDLEHTALRGEDLFFHLSSLRAESVVLFLDTCKAGASPAQVRLLERLQTQTGLVVFSAAQANHSSLESQRWQNGAFTRALVEGFHGAADVRGDGRVTASSLEHYLGRRVRELTAGDQEPTTIKASSDLWLVWSRPQYYRRWWLWTVVGAVAAGGVLGAALGISLRPQQETIRFYWN